MKKKFLPSFQPPRIVKGAQGWYVVWYELHPATGELTRFRNTFRLNRIPSKKVRAERAQAILEEITRALAGGGYGFSGPQENGLGFTPLMEAMQIAIKLKAQTGVEATNKSYSSIIRIFSTWSAEARLDGLPIKAFSRMQALRFLDSRRALGVGGRTVNNYITFLRSIWNAFKERGYIEANPWTQVKKAKEEAKRRRTFSPAEVAAVASYIAAKNQGLFAAILLQYYCFIRPNEIRQLRRSDFDLEKGMITIPAQVAKVKKTRLVTMPETVRMFFADHYGKVPPTYYIWGPSQTPHPRQIQGKNQYHKAHNYLLKQMQKKKLLGDIRGLTFYSWKDTGLTTHAREISLLDLMHQAGHHDPKITLVYVHQGKENEAFRAIDGPLIGK